MGPPKGFLLYHPLQEDADFWDGVLPLPAPPQSESLGSAEAAPPRAGGDVDALAARAVRARAFLPTGFPGPLRRTPEQHALVAARMRERRAALLMERRQRGHEGQMRGLLRHLQEAGTIFNSSLRRRLRGRVPREALEDVLAVPDGDSRRVPWVLILEVAYRSDFHARQLSRQRRMQRQTPAQCWATCARALQGAYPSGPSGAADALGTQACHSPRIQHRIGASPPDLEAPMAKHVFGNIWQHLFCRFLATCVNDGCCQKSPSRQPPARQIFGNSWQHLFCIFPVFF